MGDTKKVLGNTYPVFRKDPRGTLVRGPCRSDYHSIHPVGVLLSSDNTVQISSDLFAMWLDAWKQPYLSQFARQPSQAEPEHAFPSASLHQHVRSTPHFVPEQSSQHPTT